MPRSPSWPSLLVADVGGIAQSQSGSATPAARAEARQAGRAKPNLEGGEDRPGLLRVAAAVTRAVTKAIRAVTGAAGWLVHLWRQADQHTDRHGHPPSTTTPTSEAMPRSPAADSPSTRRLL